MKIKIITVGKISKSWLLDLGEFYLNKIKHYADIEILELNEVNDKQPNVNVKIETKNIISKIEKLTDYLLIGFDIKGKLVSSSDFSKIIEDNKNLGSAKIAFVIGGSDGFDSQLDNYLKLKLSFGKITYPHQLFRCIVLEQIYRSFKIINNEKYHK